MESAIYLWGILLSYLKPFPHTKQIKMCNIKIPHDNKENHIIMNPEKQQQ